MVKLLRACEAVVFPDTRVLAQVEFVGPWVKKTFLMGFFHWSRRL
jgi:hypothetical protein